ncbi:MAG: amidohydrolase family protein [Rhodoplanes sp.]|uniref:amidohydrolase family protein n=1 Tax=Rhodoplanes sp. TaxID=1968906 RepID=UPI00182E70FD|nr:amidohydrolase family protein [Rhodoplanes sp.]NVO17194.1 amidohydrolase family protein [Rhodoplanes sp.]
MTQVDRQPGQEPTCPPPDPHPKKPAYVPPPGACDAHFHIFGPGDVFPYAPKRPFTPPDAPKARLLALHHFLGFERGVFVQSSCHGTDHAALLDLLATTDGRYRGVALLTPGTAPEEVARLHAAGVRGVRFNFLQHLGGRPSLDDMRTVIELVRPHGWHVAIHVTGKELLDSLDLITSIRAKVVIDHIGRVDVAEGTAGFAFGALKRLLDRGTIWVKLSGVDRISRAGPPFADAVALARALVRHAPERVVWGTDWPHPNISRFMPNDGELVDLIPQIAEDARTQRLMLVDNPTELFEFDKR